MNLKTVAEHTVDLDLLTDRPVVDAGCRDFAFSRWFSDRGHPVVMIDPAPDVKPPQDFMDRLRWSFFLPAALVGDGMPSRCGLVVCGNASHVTWRESTIETVSISSLYKTYGLFDVVKLDIEGSEYEVLLRWPGPLSRQITVEFHEHLKMGKDIYGDDIYDRIDTHLRQWYVRMKHEALPFDGGLNYYDSLWVLR